MKDNMMKYFKLLMLIITLLPNVGYTYETPNTPYVDELRKMRGILIKSQLCVEKKYLQPPLLVVQKKRYKQSK